MPENVAYNMDCMEYMRTLPDKSFDLAVVDPMYGIGENGAKSGSRAKLAKRIDYKPVDDTPPDREYFLELFRVSKNQIIWGANHFVEAISKMPLAGLYGIKIMATLHTRIVSLRGRVFPAR